MFGNLDPNDDEFESIETFAEYLMDDERTEFTHVELGCLNRRLGLVTHTIRKELESYGFTLKHRAKEQSFRGFSTSSHDRWYGPGSSKSHGGSGWEQISGFAGQKG